MEMTAKLLANSRFGFAFSRWIGTLKSCGVTVYNNREILTAESNQALIYYGKKCTQFSVRDMYRLTSKEHGLMQVPVAGSYVLNDGTFEGCN